MTAATFSPAKRNVSLLIVVASSAIVTFLLFFIDEGYYNLNWTARIGNWVAFGIYVTTLTLGQILAKETFLKKYNGKNKTLLTALIGIPLGIAFIFALFYLKMAL